MSKRVKQLGWRAVVTIVAAVAIVSWLRTESPKAQNLDEALPGQGVEVTVDAPIQIVAANLPVVRAAAAGPVQMHEERFIMPEAEFRAAKRQAAVPGFGPQLPVTAQGAPAQVNALTPGASINFEGMFMGSTGCGSWIPADQALAVGDGTNPVVQAVNECIRVTNLAGGILGGPWSLQSFFGVASTVSVCDPRALFDWRNHRFIVIAITCSAPYTSKVAVSMADNPLGGWWVYTFASSSSSGAIMDYPRLGQDHTATYPGSGFAGGIYIAYNLFNPGYVHEEWHILPKGRMYAGAGFSYWAFWGMTSGGLLTDSTQPANVFSPYERPRAEFLVTSRNGCSSPCNALTVWAISNPFQFVSGGDAPQLTGTVIAAANTWTMPPDAPQPGGPNTVDTLDNRITGEATYAHGHLHAAHSTANGAGGTATQIYKIQPFLNRSAAGCTTSVDLCPQITGALLRNETVLNYGGTTAAWMAVPQPDLDGNVTTVFNYSNTVDQYPGIAYISQRVTQAPGSFQDSGIFLVTGLGTYTRGRWGDYMAVAPAGIAYRAGDAGITGTNTMLFSGMYSDTTANNRWRTRVGGNAFTAPAQYSPSGSN